MSLKNWCMLPVLLLSVTSIVAGTLDENVEVQYSSVDAAELLAKSNELAAPVAIYEYVRNNIEYALYHGSRSGSINTFLGGRGSDVDIASTLIAMLRSQNISARYATGNIRVAADQVQSWLGVHDVDLAYSLMRDQGIQNVTLAADKSYIDFDHVWVEALVLHSHYRGAGPDAQNSAVDCAADPADCHWVALDPSFKLRQFHNQNIDIYDQISFDYDAYYNAIKNNSESLLDKSPLEIYQEQILDYLAQNHLGKTLEDVADAGVIVAETAGLLPASLPYQLVGPSASYDNISDYDAVATIEWTKYVNVDLNLCTNFSAPPLALAELATKRFTLTYELGASNRLAFRLDGVDFFVPFDVGTLSCSGTLVDQGFPFTMEITLDGAPDPDGGAASSTIDVSYQNLVVGGYYLIGTGGDSSNWSQVHRAAGELLAANQQFPIVNDFSDSNFPNGIPYVDANGNGSIDSGELRLLDHATAQDELTGGLLFTAMSLYFAEFSDSIRRFDHLNHVITPIEGFVGLVSSVYDVEYLDGTAFAVMPGGLLIDMKGVSFNGLWRDSAPEEYASTHFELLGHQGSSLEHEIWQQITGFDALSTVRGLQLSAGYNGATVLDIRKDSVSDTLDSLYAATDFTSALPSPWTMHEHTVYSTQPVTWSNSNGNQSMSALKRDINSSTPSHRRKAITYYNGPDNDLAYGWIGCADAIEDWLLDGKAQNGGQVTFVSDWIYCGDTLIPASTTIDEALVQTENIYLTQIVPNYIADYNIDGAIYNYLDIFDKTRGFVVDEYVYRDDQIFVNDHTANFIQQVRNNVSLEVVGAQQEYVLPSKKPAGALYQFSVYINRLINDVNGHLASLSFTISNESNINAGGGYVHADETIDVTADATGAIFNNELFTDENLNAYINNDLIRTPSTADPVSTVTGNMYHDETDLAIKGRELDYVFTRTFNSGKANSSSTDQPLSQGWTHSYNMSLVANDEGQFPNYDATAAPENDDNLTSSITYVDERGGELNHLVDSYGGSFAITPPHGNFDSLALDTPVAGQYTLTFRSGVEYIFEDAVPGAGLDQPGNAAHLLRIEDPWGNQLQFGYTANQLTSITDNLGVAGRTGLQLSYTANKLDTITDWSGRTWTYGYDANGRLTSASNPLSHTTSYTYSDDTNYLNQIILPADRDSDGNGDVTTSFAYYQNGKTFNNANAFGHGETIDYDLFRKSTRVTDPRGFIRTHHYSKDGAMTKLEEPDGAILRFKNNADGLRFSKLDGLGYETQYSYQSDRSLGEAASNTGGLVTLEQDALNNSVEFDYGVFDQPTRVQDKNGTEQTRSYYTTTNAGSGALADKLHQVRATVNGTANVLLSEYQYFADGNLKQQIEYIDPADLTRKRVTDYSYDSDGYNLTDVIVNAGADQLHMHYTYDNLGRKLTETLYRQASPVDATLVALTTTTEYDSLGRPVKVTNPRGDIAESVYDDNGNVIEQKIHALKPGGGYDLRTVATHTYDSADRRITSADIDGNTTSFVYDQGTNILSTTDALGHTAHFEYDERNRRTAVIDANGHRTESIYDLAGQLVKVIDANGNTTKFEYDELGRQTKIISPLGHESVIGYDANGNQTQLTDANALVSTTTYDELNRPTVTTDPDSQATTQTYDLLGNITSITDAENQLTEMVYDNFGRLIEVIDPIIETTDLTTTISYDQAGNPLSVTDRKGQIVQTEYDLLNRPIQVDYLTDATQDLMVYDHFGDLVSVTNPDVTYSYTFDNQHRLIEKTDSRVSCGVSCNLQWSYDTVGNITTKTDYQGDVTHYQYDSSNRLVSLQNSAYLQVSYRYDGAGRLLNRILSNGVQTNYQYDADSRLTQLTNLSASGDKVHQQTYSHDSVGNITSVVQDIDNDGDYDTINYGYDPLYRLLSADYPDASDDEIYTYDNVGNRETITRGGNTLAYLYGNGNRLNEIRQSSPTGTLLTSYEYDANGSRIAQWPGAIGAGTATHAYIFDARNRVASITVDGANTANFGYDPSNYRINKQSGANTEKYYLEGEHLEATYDGSDSLRTKYLRGVVIDEIVNGYEYDGAGGETNLNFHHDQINSVTAVTTHDGDAAEQIAYTPFGELLNQSGIETSDLRYTGRQLDSETGLYYYRARYYDPVVGRFISEDPLGFEAGVNFYAYVGNNPISRNDPTGLFFTPETLLDFAFIAYDLDVIRRDGLSWTNGLALGLDVIGAAVPVLTGGGAAVHAVTGAANGVEGIRTIGRLADTSAYRNSPDHNVIPSTPWSPEINYDWIQQGVDRRENFAVVSPINSSNLTDTNTGFGTVFAQELNQIQSGANGYVSNSTGTLFTPGPYTGSRIAGVGVGINFSDQIDQSFGGGGDILNPFASGGFVLYPNKNNTNMSKSVYRK